MTSLRIKITSLTLILALFSLSTIWAEPVHAKKKKVLIPAIIGGAILLNEAMKNKKYKGKKKSKRLRVRKNKNGVPEKVLTRQQVILVQQALNFLNYNVGDADGIAGQGTRLGIKKYQSDIGHESTGYLTEAEYQSLVLNKGEIVKNDLNGQGEQYSEYQEDEPLNEYNNNEQYSAEQFYYTDHGAFMYWEGRLKCSKGLKLDRDIIAHFERKQANRFNGVITVFYPWSSLGRASWDYFVGEKEAGTNQYFFARTRKKLHGLDRINGKTFQLVKGEGETLELIFSDKRCAAVKLSPVLKKDFAPLVKLANVNQGTFFQARNDADRCRVLINWAKKLNANSVGRHKNWQILFTDKIFIPVFGKAYNSYSHQDRKNFTQYNRNKFRYCTNDPLLNARFKDADQALRYGFYYDWDHAGYIVRQVIKNRRILNQVKRLEDQINSENLASDNFKQFGELINIVGQNKQLLDTADYKAITIRLQKKQNDLARKFAFQQYDKLIAEADQQKQLELLKSYNSSSSEYKSYLSVEDKKEIDDRYARLGNQLAGQFLPPIMAQIEQEEESLDGLKRIDSAHASAKRYLNLVAASEKKKFDNKYSIKKMTILKSQTNQRLSLLNEHGNTRAGISKTDLWIEKFNSDFGNYSETEIVIDAKEKYNKHRKQQVRSSVSDFEVELKKLDKSSPAFNSEISNLLHKYLTQKSDFKSPVLLSYLFVINESFPKSQIWNVSSLIK